MEEPDSTEGKERLERRKVIKHWIAEHGLEVLIGLALIPFGSFTVKSIYEHRADLASLSSQKSELNIALEKSEARLEKQISELATTKDDFVTELGKSEARLEKQIAAIQDKGGKDLTELRQALTEVKKVIYRISTDPEGASREIENLISESDKEQLNDTPQESRRPPASPVSLPPRLQRSSNTYIVRSGDTLSRIATKYGTTSRTLQDLNGIADPKKLRIGQVVKIPVE